MYTSVLCMLLYTFLQDGGVQKDQAFQMNGTQGQLWKQANITLPNYSSLSVVFEGIVGNGYRGDIALDDITLRAGPCFGDSGKCQHKHLRLKEF